MTTIIQVPEAGAVALPVMGEKKMRACVGSVIGFRHNPFPYA